MIDSIQARHLKQLHVAHLCDPHDKRKERTFWIAYRSTKLTFSTTVDLILECIEREMRAAPHH